MEEKLEKVKVFKLTDEVEAPPVTEEEYKKIQIEILKNPNYKLMNDMRSKEINMEKENLSKVREKNKITKDILTKMIPSMQWIRPHGKITNRNYLLQSFSLHLTIKMTPTMKIMNIIMKPFIQEVPKAKRKVLSICFVKKF
jgi:hypothetical protein